MIRYEANPPKIVPGGNISESTRKFVEKIKTISEKCDAIHITENVLGFQRVPPLKVGEIIKKEMPDIPVTVSLRVRDKSEEEITSLVQSYVKCGFSGVLVLMGDPSQSGKKDSGLIPSATITMLKKMGLDSEIDLYLSISNMPDPSKIGRKVRAGPAGFMTQVVQNLEQVQRLRDCLSGFAVIPIILYPSEKNEKSAKFLGLDLEGYGADFGEFVSKAHQITGDILLTSPNDFGGLCEFLDAQS